jgi:hypothetical protein
MAKYKGPKDRLDAARNVETSADELKILATSQYDFVLTAVAAHPNTTSETLASLIPDNPDDWNTQERAAAIAQHPKSTTETLAKLCERIIPFLNQGRGNDFAMRAGVNLCCNINTQIETVQSLINDMRVSTQLRKVIARETRRADVLQLLTQDRSEVVRKRAFQTIDDLKTTLVCKHTQ